MEKKQPTSRHAPQQIKPSRAEEKIGTLSVFYLLPLRRPFRQQSDTSVIFSVMLFVPTLIRHIAFLFSIDCFLSGKNKKSKSRPDPRTKRHGQKIKPQAILT
jgi:hypothetical protein